MGCYPLLSATECCHLKMKFPSLRKHFFAMDRTEKDYVAFERAMDDAKVYRGMPDYLGICLLIGAEPAALDRMIYEELGFRGQDLVDRYRMSEYIH